MDDDHHPPRRHSRQKRVIVQYDHRRGKRETWEDKITTHTLHWHRGTHNKSTSKQNREEEVRESEANMKNIREERRKKNVPGTNTHINMTI